MAQAFASDVSGAESLPASSETSIDTAATDSASVDAIDPPVEETTTEGVIQEQGPIPYLRHKSVLDGAYKERDTFKSQLDEFQQKYGWAQQVDPAEFQQIQTWSQAYRQDPVRWFADTAAQLRQTHPELAQSLHSEAARVLAGARQSQPSQAAADLEPDIPVMDSNGQVVTQAYSADRVKQLIAKSVQDAIAKEVGPIRQDFQTRQAREKDALEEQQRIAHVKDIYAEAVEVLPGFEAHKDAIAKAYESIPGDPARALRKAWWEVVGKQLSNANETRAKQLDEIKTKAAASTVNPAAAAVASTHRPTSMLDKSLTW